MRFAMIEHQGRVGISMPSGDTALHAVFADELHYPGSLDSLVCFGESVLRDASNIILAAAQIDRGSVTFMPPFIASRKIVCIGLNYIDHAMETGGRPPPSYPTVFARFASSLIGHGVPMIRPRLSNELDFEGELVAVIGTGGRDIPRERALDHIIGYSVFNDGSVRDYQSKSPQWTVGKNFDGSGAFGPFFVTADELPHGAKGLKIETRLNGETVQSANTSDMVFSVETLVSLLSEAFTWEPGDIIVTGTPAGVGMARKPPLWMKAGDVCEVEIEAIGLLSNAIVQQA